MSDVQTEEIVAEGEKYPAILDEVDPDQLVWVQDIVRKERPLAEGPFANSHNAWKKKELIDVLDRTSDAFLFINLGGLLANLKLFLDTGSSSHLAMAIVGAVGSFCVGVATYAKHMKEKESQDSDASPATVTS